MGLLQIVLGYVVARVILCAVPVLQYYQGGFYTGWQSLEKRFGRRIGNRTIAAGLGGIGAGRHHCNCDAECEGNVEVAGVVAHDGIRGG